MIFISAETTVSHDNQCGLCTGPIISIQLHLFKPRWVDQKPGRQRLCRSISCSLRPMRRFLKIWSGFLYQGAMSSSCNLEQMLSNIYSRKCAKHLPVCAPAVSYSADWVCCTLLWQVKVFCQPESFFAPLQGIVLPTGGSSCSAGLQGRNNSLYRRACKHACSSIKCKEQPSGADG